MNNGRGRPRPWSTTLRTISLGLFLFLLDQACKSWSITHWSRDPQEILTGLRFSFLLNPGVAFSMPLQTPFLAVISVPIFLGLLWWFARSILQRRAPLVLALSFMVFGATSNIIDRLRYGGVVDYLEVGMLPMINLADLMILFGVGWLMVRLRSVSTDPVS